MKRLRRASERGFADHGWLRTYHTFSFADYRDPQHVHFRALRVMNEDWVAPGQGFGEHPHHDMEIVTYVLEGQLEHRDSMGNGEILRPGEFQRMSAGSGITHSEFNPSASEPVHLYQIWLFPAEKGIEPSYEQRPFPESGRQGRWQMVAAPGGENGSLTIHQDARIYLANLAQDESLEHLIGAGRHAWLQVLRGGALVDDHTLLAGDGLAISEEAGFTVTSRDGAEVMLFDLA
ncbi:MAG TPA: pirin family protein [Pirellulaceae bacterium]|nr:pirin family protein [Pirellulaceae bacterium]HMO93907.1 pirin family protein [Pirellulaceae bacterium]HMP68945.1 pirin family protein [Pirellulaceae bacterium]